MTVVVLWLVIEALSVTVEIGGWFRAGVAIVLFVGAVAMLSELDR